MYEFFPKCFPEGQLQKWEVTLNPRVSGDFANEWFRQCHIRQRLWSLGQHDESLGQRPTGHFANLLVYSK